MECQGGVQPTVGDVFAEGLIRKTQAEVRGINRQAHAANALYWSELTDELLDCAAQSTLQNVCSRQALIYARTNHEASGPQSTPECPRDRLVR